MLSCRRVTGCGGWHSRQRWRRLWWRLWVGSRVGCLSLLGGGMPVPLCLQRVCRFFAVPFGQGRQPGVWFWRSIARCHCITVLTFFYPGNSTPHFFFSQTSARGFLIRYCLSLIVACENSALPILAIFKARRMSDCFSCTQPPCLAIMAEMFNTYKKLVVASNNEMRLLPQPYMLL